MTDRDIDRSVQDRLSRPVQDRDESLREWLREMSREADKAWKESRTNAEAQWHLGQQHMADAVLTRLADSGATPLADDTLLRRAAEVVIYKWETARLGSGWGDGNEALNDLRAALASQPVQDRDEGLLRAALDRLVRASRNYTPLYDYDAAQDEEYHAALDEAVAALASQPVQEQGEGRDHE